VIRDQQEHKGSLDQLDQREHKDLRELRDLRVILDRKDLQELKDLLDQHYTLGIGRRQSPMVDLTKAIKIDFLL
jgi:hypothetical protein